MKYEIPEDLVQRILRNAKREVLCEQEDFCANDYAGGNFDDAWDGGFRDGDASLSQDLAEYLSKPVE